jgi:chromosome segregation protein
MLKQLELIGFKSFAERTIFEFGAGITAVVGPNGSGKSNVVDAIRWIMGEQSAKSLRGGGMTDVIFNGSSTRKSLGMAEVSLTLDNTKRFLNVDADDVQITRRVYRDGTGEYLINKQMTRLKDIKELFLGSGAGVDAYCIIAQGRVEALLQASSQERRFILEEAAGISRFRAKKIETLRKLEQVEQNLQRVKDIHDELLRQLQSVRLQAAKAEKFRDYSQELKRLRVGLALQEWHIDTQKWQAASNSLSAGKLDLEQHTAQSSEQEQQLAGAEAALSQCEDAIRRLESTISECREKQAAFEGSIHHETFSQSSLQQSMQQQSQREQQLQNQVQRSVETLLQLREQLARESTELEAEQLRVTASKNQQAATVKELSELRKTLQTGQDTLYERLQVAARSHNEAVSLKSQIDSLKQQRRRLQDKHSQTQGTLSALDLDLKSLEATETDIVGRMNQLRSSLQELRSQSEQLNVQLESLTAQHTSIRERRSGLESRVQVLDHLEKSREGLGSDVRQVLEKAASDSSYPWNNVVGLLADLILVDHEHAALVDAVLGDRVQTIVVRDNASMAAIIQALGSDITSRLAFLSLSALPATSSSPSIPGLEPLTQYIGTSHTECQGLVEHLLANTWLVESLEQAQHWAQHYPAQTWGTKLGEILDSKGILSLGPDSEQHGFLSRKSELRENREQILACIASLEECEQELSNVRAQLSKLHVQEQQSEQGLQVQSEEAAALRSQLQQKRLQGKDLAEEVRIGQHEIHTIDEELAKLAYTEVAANERATLADAAAQKLQQELQEAESQAHVLEQQRQRDHEAIMAASVQLAKLEQALSTLSQRISTLDDDLLQKQTELEQLHTQRTEQQQQLAQSQFALSQAQTSLEECKQQRSSLDLELTSSLEQGFALRQQLQSLREQNSQIRQVWQTLVDRIHVHEREAGELRLKLDTLASRLLEEHEVALQDEYASYVPPETLLDSAATQQQIADLRRKIHRLGNVSMDALDELNNLETRATDLQKQQEDLSQAKAALDEIIHRINGDSKKLFQQTFDAVRAHFQELFRKVFGGGMADIVLENPEDLLETGVDIVARPPGKEMRNMSLLSGGEKTLTAVALLLAIFKNKPSPFCIMDEVDAALDEANVGRFAAVIREFLHLSQFILITHSKKTMTAADVLYGVTMQEAGISKRVAMRLEEYEEPASRLAA